LLYSSSRTPSILPSRCNHHSALESSQHRWTSPVTIDSLIMGRNCQTMGKSKSWQNFPLRNQNSTAGFQLNRPDCSLTKIEWKLSENWVNATNNFNNN
jgi:hypothetical protein